MAAKKLKGNQIYLFCIFKLFHTTGVPQESLLMFWQSSNYLSSYKISLNWLIELLIFSVLFLSAVINISWALIFINYKDYKKQLAPSKIILPRENKHQTWLSKLRFS